MALDPNPATRDDLTGLLRDLLAEVRAMRRDAAQRETDARLAADQRHMDDYWLKIFVGTTALLLAAMAIAGGFIMAAIKM